MHVYRPQGIIFSQCKCEMSHRESERSRVTRSGDALECPPEDAEDPENEVVAGPWGAELKLRVVEDLVARVVHEGDVVGEEDEEEDVDDQLRLEHPAREGPVLVVDH
jgi:hypothetical protein